MALFKSGGKLLSTNGGSLASSSGCCCDDSSDPGDPGDPNRIVFCCIDGACAEISALECEFLGGQSVASCDECEPPPPQEPGFSSDCRLCCDAQEIDAVVTFHVHDPFCGGIIGQGCNSTRFFGRLGETLEFRANITMQRTLGFGCNFAFGGCFPLNQFGNVTQIDIQAGFFRQGVPPNFFLNECAFRVFSASARVNICGFPNSIPHLCTDPPGGGSCAHDIFFDPNVDADANVFIDECKGVGTIKNTSVIRWADSIFGCFSTITPLLAMGTPKRRDIGFQECEEVSFVGLDEETHTFISRATIRVL